MEKWIRIIREKTGEEGHRPGISIRDMVRTLIVIAVCSLLGELFYRVGLRDANIIMVYILGVLILGAWTNGRIYSAFFSLCSVALFNFLFTEPRFTMFAHGAEYPVTFVIMLIVGLFTSSLALRIKVQERQKKEAEMVARQESLRANLLRTISHDLRTPLTSISGNAGFLMEHADKLSEKRRRALYGDIYDDSIWLTNLVENLLAVTRLENGTMQMKQEAELIEEVFHEALLHLDRRAKEHTIRTVLEDDLLMANMDVRLIIQVIVNIVNNAIKYTQPGSCIVLEAKERDGLVEFRISDDGPGIGEEEKENIFDMFYTADNVRGDGRRGLGLGLSLCKSIVNAHGGRIWVEDAAPHGAVFCFTLKAVEVNSCE